MAQLFLDIFILICLGLIFWGTTKPERIYQFPFIMGFIFFSFLLPQAIALVQNPAGVPADALTRVMLFSCMCAGCCWLGYQIQPNRKILNTITIRLDDKRLFWAGVVLTFIGHIFAFLLRNTIANTTSDGLWTGPATIYIFLFQVLYIALAIFLLQLLKKPTYGNLIFTIVSAIPLIQFILAGRRQSTMTFAVIVGLAFFMSRKVSPPRWFGIAFILSTTFLIPVVGQLRNEFWVLLFTGNWTELLAATQLSFGRLVEGEILELRNAALLMDAANLTNEFGFGKGYWDVVVFQYVPAQILGAGFKSALQFKEQNFDLETLYGYSIHVGTTVTGVGDTYLEFCYYGCLVFVLIAYLFKHLWIAGVYRQSMPCQILYAGLISPSMVSLTHGTGRFLQEFIFQLIFVLLIVMFCRQKPETNPSFY
jgi:hypothetical protein